MAFTLETGTGVSGANGYIDADFADTYHTDRNNSGWAIATASLPYPDPQDAGEEAANAAFVLAAKQAAIIKASEYIDKRFQKLFRGYKSTREQGLEWPRTNAYDDDDYLFSGVPSALQKATAEYALRALSLSILAPDPALGFKTRDSVGTGTTESQGNAQKVKKKVGPIETSFDMGENSTDFYKASTSGLVSGNTIPEYPEADMLIQELIHLSMSNRLSYGG